jgi:RHS repeat-associated protein
LGSGEYPQVLEGNGTELLRKYEFGLPKQFADGEGRLTTLTRDSGGAGYITGILENDGGQTTFTHDYAGRVLTRTNPMGGVRTYTYNANGFLLTETDELGRVTTYTRDTNNRIMRTDYPDGAYETFTYTGTGLLKTHRLRSGSTETLTYDSWGNIATRVDAAGYTWTYTASASGLPATVTDPRNFTTTTQYNWRGLLVKVTYPDANFREYGYTAHGKRSSVKDELGHIWSFTYTEYNQLASRTDPLSRTTSYEYGREPGCGSCGYLPTLSKLTLPSGKITEMHYDASGKLLSRVVAPGTPDAATTSYTYGTNGLADTMTDPRGKTTHYTYDLLHRKTSEIDPLSHITQWGYDDADNVLTLTRADASVTSHTYDAMNRLLTTTNPKNETTTYTYHPDGSMASLTDARGSAYTFDADALGRRTKMTYPGGSYEQWTYDGAGNMTLYRARNGATKTCTYDNRNRDTLCDWSDSTLDVSKGYDGAGRLTSLVNANCTLTYGYDAANQLLSETYIFGGAVGTKTVSYSYDADGNRDTLTYPDGFAVSATYTGRNQVKDITAGGPPPLANFTYDTGGNRLTKTLENGTTASYAYDDVSRLTTVTHANSSTTISALSYGYNAINLRTSGEAGDTYGYDAADQLATVTYAATGNATTYTYDAAGNREEVDDGTVIAHDPANALNQYTVITGVSAIGYDSRGNLSSYGGASFTHDSDNRLLTGVKGADVAAFTRDARQRIVARTINGGTTFGIYDKWNLIAEYDASGAQVAKYIHGPKTDEMLAKIDASGTVYYHENALGCIVALSHASGSAVECYTYDVYGLPTIKDASGATITSTVYGNRFLFTGREWIKELGIYDYRNRAYSPELGRFLETDPIRFKAGDVNIYRYVLNDPTNWTDFSGKGLSSVDTPEGAKAAAAAAELSDGLIELPPRVPPVPPIIPPASTKCPVKCTFRRFQPSPAPMGEGGNCVYDCEDGSGGTIPASSEEKCPKTISKDDIHDGW